MLAACDIGNTNIKCGLFENDSLTEFKVFPSPADVLIYLQQKNLKNIAISSVVPSKLSEIKNSGLPNLRVYEINKNSAFTLKVDYDTPETLGIDRLCACEGAFYLFNQEKLSKLYNEKTIVAAIDFGTATTINVIKYPGIFTGGIIAPGVGLMFDSLNSRTAQLPLTEPLDFKDTIGKTTKQAIASGVINSQAGLIEKTFEKLKIDAKAEKIFAYLTGGNAESIKPHLTFEFTYEKALVLYGIKAVYDNSGSK